MKGLCKVEALEKLSTLIVGFEHKLKNCDSNAVPTLVLPYALAFMKSYTPYASS